MCIRDRMRRPQILLTLPGDQSYQIYNLISKNMSSIIITIEKPDSGTQLPPANCSTCNKINLTDTTHQSYFRIYEFKLCTNNFYIYGIPDETKQESGVSFDIQNTSGCETCENVIPYDDCRKQMLFNVVNYSTTTPGTSDVGMILLYTLVPITIVLVALFLYAVYKAQVKYHNLS
eukprot:TRINITY_DN6825_c0_g1_i1.p1 TRINITY_DN6825_c0_g1~~TRINITY_DN6825_c0_g1_i1.p1  ORF type:complete len:195 (-),score=23.39 TRINITY_DN6825_c0_g1_i1:243-767(-)